MAHWYKKLPNWLTCIRLLLIPVFVVFMLSPTRASLNVAAVIFVLAALTDYADGFLARRYGAITDFGKLFDPLADKILVMAALVMLVSVRDDQCYSFVPGWMVVVILAREFWVTGLRAFAARDGNVVSAKSGGKVKSFLQMLSIFLILLGDYAFSILGYRLTYQFVGLNLLLVSIAFSLVSAVDYSMMILAPEKKGFGECLAALRTALIGGVSDSTDQKGALKEPPAGGGPQSG